MGDPFQEWCNTLQALRLRESGRFFLGPNRAVVPKPTDAANRCNLRHVTPKTFQKALYVGFSQIGRVVVRSKGDICVRSKGE